MKKAIVMVLALFAATGAYAARITDVDIESDVTMAVVAFSYADSLDEQVATILVLPSDKSIINYSDEDICYMGQKKVEGSMVSFTVPLKNSAQTYTYYLGGIDLDSYATGTIALINDGLSRIRGSASVRGGANITRVSVSAGTATAALNEGGGYTLVVEPGIYDVVLGREGYLYKTYKDVDATSSINLGNVELYGGDVTADGVIDNIDLQEILTAWGESSDGQENLDINDDGIINLADFQIILANEGKSYE
ncbi:MAG: hypothetical protein Q4C12_02255 [Clostridia bacterium]|nr:hypothetical protein [Clostridia bacterium]